MPNAPHYDPREPLVVLRRFRGSCGMCEPNTPFIPSEQGPNCNGDTIVQLMTAGYIRHGRPVEASTSSARAVARRAKFELGMAQKDAKDAEVRERAARVSAAMRGA